MFVLMELVALRQGHVGSWHPIIKRETDQEKHRTELGFSGRGRWKPETN